MTLRGLAEDLWCAEQPLRFLGIEVGARMTVVRLPGSRLVLHSPIEPAKELVRQVTALGDPAWLLAPNRFHHLFVGRWQASFPRAAVLAAPGVAEKRPDLRAPGVLGETTPPGWEGVLECVALEGFPLANEVVCFHRPSATLIASDLAFHIGPEAPRLTRLAVRLGGAYGRLAPTHLERIAIRDRAAYRRSLDRVLAWPFERVVVAHGTVLERGGREALARGYAWLD